MALSKMENHIELSVMNVEHFHFFDSDSRNIVTHLQEDRWHCCGYIGAVQMPALWLLFLYCARPDANCWFTQLP